MLLAGTQSNRGMLGTCSSSRIRPFSRLRSSRWLAVSFSTSYLCTNEAQLGNRAPIPLSGSSPTLVNLVPGREMVDSCCDSFPMEVSCNKLWLSRLPG